MFLNDIKVVVAAGQIFCKTSITEITQTSLVLPAAGQWGCDTRVGDPARSKYVTSIESSDEGAVRVVLQGINATANGQALILRPWVNILRAAAVTTGDAIGVWDCGPDPEYPRHLDLGARLLPRFSGPNRRRHRLRP